MRNRYGIFVFAVLLTGFSAHAQFANKSLGLQVGVLDLNGTKVGIHDPAVPINLNGSLYLENHFELTAAAGVLIYTIRNTPAPRRAAIDGALGVRYLFLEENIRPYVGIGLTPLWFVGQTGSDNSFTTSDASLFYIGGYAAAGVEFFVDTSVSIGVKLQGNYYLALNDTASAYGGYVYAAAYF